MLLHSANFKYLMVCNKESLIFLVLHVLDHLTLCSLANSPGLSSEPQNCLLGVFSYACLQKIILTRLFDCLYLPREVWRKSQDPPHLSVYLFPPPVIIQLPLTGFGLREGMRVYKAGEDQERGYGNPFSQLHKGFLVWPL